MTEAIEFSLSNKQASSGGLTKNDENPTSKVFIDLTDRVTRSSNEEGLIGFAFHPDYKNNGYVYCHYSSERDRPEKTAENSRPIAPNIVARYKISDDPNVLDAATEKVLMKIPQPYANHNGGAMAFGKDGFLYLALGDGGFRNDPHGNGQNLKTLLGSILRIDINSESDGKSYGIPADNPFIKTPDARPEIYALGLRNVWRFSFDRETGELWARPMWAKSELKKSTLFKKGGNYGWKRFEANDDFAADVKLAIGQHDKPVAFYGHEWGGSITGGHVLSRRKISAAHWFLFLWRLHDRKPVAHSKKTAKASIKLISFDEPAEVLPRLAKTSKARFTY